MKADYYRDDKKAIGDRSQKTFNEEADTLRAMHHQQHAGGKDYCNGWLSIIITYFESFNKWLEDDRIDESLLEISAFWNHRIDGKWVDVSFEIIDFLYWHRWFDIGIGIDN